MPNDFTTTNVSSFIPTEAEELLQSLAETDDTWAAGAALYGPFGLFDPMRKAKLAVIALQIRDGRDTQGLKTTEGLADQLSHGDDTYVAFLDAHVIDRAKWLSLDAERERIKSRLRFWERR